MTTLAFVDCETTGLDPGRHQPWEVAVILRELDGDGCSLTRDAENEHTWQLPVDLERADATALSIGRFYERRAAELSALDGPSGFAAEFAKMTHGAHLIGAVPSFDAGMLTTTLRLNGACPGWHHRLICVETLALGHNSNGARTTEDCPLVPAGLAVAAGWNGIEVDEDAAHTALGDARLARDVYDACMGHLT